MRFRYDMDAVRPEQRLDRFRKMLIAADGENCVSYTFGSEDFTARVRGRRFGPITIGDMTMSSHKVALESQAAKARGDDTLLVGFNCGSPIESVQGNREAVSELGDARFFAQTRPYTSVSGSARHRSVLLQLPRKELVERLGDVVDDLAGQPFSGKLPAQRLASRYFAALGASLDKLDDTLVERRIAEGLDLFAFAVQEQIGGSLADTTVHRSAMRIRLKSLILSRLGDPGFSLAEAATRFGVSPRYINNLLADDGTSFGRFLIERRLLACRRELADPRLSMTAVIDVAFRWGFNDAAHFSRAFKARFGMPPREYQRESLRLRLAAAAAV